MARPCLVTRIGDMPRWIRDGESGFVADRPEVGEVRRALERAWEARIGCARWVAARAPSSSRASPRTRWASSRRFSSPPLSRRRGAAPAPRGVEVYFARLGHPPAAAPVDRHDQPERSRRPRSHPRVRREPVVRRPRADRGRWWLHRRERRVIRASGALVSDWLSERDRGVYDAQNKGLARARGTFVLFLNSGDSLAAPDALERLLAGPPPEGIVLRRRARRARWRQARAVDVPGPGDLRVPDARLAAHPATVIRREVFERIGPYDANLKIVADYELFLRAIVMERVTTRHVPYAVAVHVAGGIVDQSRRSRGRAAEGAGAHARTGAPRALGGARPGDAPAAEAPAQPVPPACDAGPELVTAASRPRRDELGPAGNRRPSRVAASCNKMPGR